MHSTPNKIYGAVSHTRLKPPSVCPKAAAWGEGCTWVMESTGGMRCQCSPTVAAAQHTTAQQHKPQRVGVDPCHLLPAGWRASGRFHCDQRCALSVMQVPANGPTVAEPPAKLPAHPSGPRFITGQNQGCPYHRYHHLDLVGAEACTRAHQTVPALACAMQLAAGGCRRPAAAFALATLQHTVQACIAEHTAVLWFRPACHSRPADRDTTPEAATATQARLWPSSSDLCGTVSRQTEGANLRMTNCTPSTKPQHMQSDTPTAGMGAA